MRATPENVGILLLDNEQIFEHGQQAAAHGISMAIHAIGDRANHEVLLAYAQLRRYEQRKSACPRCATASSMCRSCIRMIMPGWPNWT